MKKKLVLLFGTLLFVSGCAPSIGEDEEVLQNPENSPVETSIVPANRLDGSNYRTVLPYRTSEARGVITDQLANRVDIDEMEQGLRRHSTEVFNPEQLFFQEGRYLSTGMVQGMINDLNPDRTDMDDWSRDDHEANPRIFSHVLEQNFLLQGEGSTVELAGISLGIALKSVYRYQVDDRPYSYDISMNEMLDKGYEVADAIVEELRQIEGLENVPILVALYREEAHSSPVPGSYVTKTVVPEGSNSTGEWETIAEENILFPSNEASSKYLEDAELFNSYGQEIAKFFPNYVGAIGQGFYKDGELQQLTIEVPIQFYGKAEVIGFTQYSHKLVKDIFHNYYDLEIQVTSSNGIESLIYRKAQEEEPTIHIFH
ncbi:CamS family sex pheromone protein [Oceanobacillus sp. CAU 1775]